MKLPELKFCDRRRIEGNDVPEMWEWPEKETAVYRPRLSFMLPRATEGAIVLLLELADFRNPKKYFIPWYESFTDANILLDKLRELRRDYEVHDIYSRMNDPERDFLQYHNEQHQHREPLMVYPPPKCDDKGSISYHLNLMKSLMQHGRERVFFPEGSNIPGQLNAIPEMAGEISDAEYPGLAALVYGVAALYHNETVEPEPGHKQRKPWSPWDKLAGFDAREILDRSLAEKMKYYRDRR